MKTVYHLQKEWKREVAGIGCREFELPLRTAEFTPGEETLLSRNFCIPESDDNRKYYLILSRLSGDCRILLDGEAVGTQHSLFAPVCTELTERIVKGKRQTLQLRLTPEADPAGDLTFGDARIVGVSRSHFDRSVPAACPLNVRTVFVKEGVSLIAEAAVADPNNYDIICYRLTDPRGRTVEIRTEKPTAPRTVFSLPVPELWDGAHAAYKYTLEATLKRDAAVLDSTSVTFGVRKTELGSDGFFRLNDLKLPLGGVVLRPAREDPADAEELQALDANCVRISTLSQDERFLNFCDEQGVLVFFDVPPAMVNDEAALAGTLRLLSAHPSVCFVCCDSKDISCLNQFADAVRKYAPDLFTAGGCDLLREDSLADAVPDVLMLDVADAGDSGVFLELENRFAAVLREHPNYRFAVFAQPPECIFDRHSVHAVRPDCSQEYFSMWHEKIWHIFNNKKGVIAYFAGCLADRDEKTQRTGLLTADREGRKDAFWFYRAQFSAEGFVKLCSSERTSVTRKYVDVKCYTNTPPIRITVNGKEKKKLHCDALSESVYVFRDVKLRRKNNTIVITAASGADSEVLFRSKSKLAKE